MVFFELHKETSCLPRQSHKSNSTMRLLMNSIERKLLIIENKHLTSAYQMEPAHKPSHFPSHGGALPNFILSHLSLCINKSQWSSYLMENKENLAMLLQTILCQFKSSQVSFIYTAQNHIYAWVGFTICTEYVILRLETLDSCEEKRPQKSRLTGKEMQETTHTFSLFLLPFYLLDTSMLRGYRTWHS